MTSEQIQQYVRIALYLVWGALAQHGVAVPDGTQALVLSAVGGIATLAWTMYGSTLTARVNEIAKAANPPAALAPAVAAAADAVAAK